MKRITIYFCKNLGYGKQQILEALELPADVEPNLVAVTCSCEITPSMLLKTYELGVDLIFILACLDGECQSGSGCYLAKNRIKYVQGLLEELGLEKIRLGLFQLPKSNPLALKPVAEDIKQKMQELERIFYG